MNLRAALLSVLLTAYSPFAGAAETEKRECKEESPKISLIMFEYGISFVGIATKRDKPYLRGTQYAHVGVSLLSDNSYFGIAFDEEQSEREGEDSISVSGFDIDGKTYAKHYVASIVLGRNLMRREGKKSTLELYLQVEGGMDLELKYLKTKTDQEKLPSNPDLDFLYGLGLKGLASTTLSRLPIIYPFIDSIPWLRDIEVGTTATVSGRRVNITDVNPIEGGNTSIVGTLSLFIAR